MGIATLGALAGGLNAGLVQGQNRLDTLAERDRIAARQKRVDDRQDQEWAREDEQRATLEAANAAGREVMQRYADEWKKQQPGPTLDGSPVPVNPFQPTPKMRLEASEAATNKLFDLKGPTQAWATSFARDEAMRATYRNDAFQRVQQAAMIGGDMTEPVSDYFSTLGIGKVERVGKTVGLDGKPSVVLKLEGQPEASVIPADEFLKGMADVAADPKAWAQHRYATELQKQRHKDNLEEISKRGETERENAKSKHGLTLEEIAARGTSAERVAGIRVGGAKSSATKEAQAALTRRAISASQEVNSLIQQLKGARPTEKPEIQRQLDEARDRVRQIDAELRDLQTGGEGTPTAQTATDPGAAVMDAATRDAQKQGLDSFTVESKLVNGGRPTTVNLKKSGAAPASSPAASTEPDQFQTGRVYRDASGNRAKYLGNGKWQPL